MRKVLVLVSGGLDSSTVLAMVKQEDVDVYGISFDYGQRHKHELEAVKQVVTKFNVKHKVININLDQIGGSSLTDANMLVPKDNLGNNIPVTYVPARNTIFLSIALAYAEVIGANDIYIGVNAIDYSNYPDCRPEFIECFEKLANIATKKGVEGSDTKIHAPLIKMSKADIVKEGTRLGVDYSITHSCYDPNEIGESCGKCDACLLRLKGFADAGLVDPIKYIK
jgi:7-cyano-7-deazaguanine synthase